MDHRAPDRPGLTRRHFLLLLPFAAAGCGAAPAPRTAATSTRSEIGALSSAIAALGPGVDPEEAARAADIAITYPLALRAAYGVTDPPLIHNTKVNMGLRPRGLCWHWAEDMETRLATEGFRTLDLHRAIANAGRIRIDHSTVVISARGGPMESGIVLDPWRNGGELFWSRVPEDRRYAWERRAAVMARRRG
ncbi:lipoprotein, putative [Pseudooceanicola batsensis HTCC2597]|uniref:Lipoprotein, putative n=1 Tax=Pseudooceanicola batsensis (strain ATCC BAA-863 / DSM 15984 / KCTC 12145 / HTCC2597) TaxID=252305 RepID=A3TTX4_PSEBH|nr:hypothetical protein [Pseudooceanicola batsensis]EAQ05101.1 lipoprotein, putative [Pseudooceanicola batsensis HTCC2597]